MTLNLSKRPFTKLYSIFLFIAVSFTCVVADNLKEDSSDNQNILQLEAAFITKFVNFIEWPAESQIDDKEVPFTITILGNHPFERSLQQIYDKAEIKVFGKDIKIKHINNIKELGKTNILFISESEKDNLKEIADFIKSKPILTISDTEGFAENCVHINFYLRTNNTLHFEINESMIKASPLIMSVRLLSIAKIVRNEL